FMQGEIMEVKFYVSTEDQYLVTFGEFEEAYLVSNDQDLEIELLEEGNFTLEVSGPQNSSDMVTVTVIGEQIVEDPPADAILGADYLDDENVRFLIEAPGKASVFLIGSFSEWEIRSENQLKRSEDGNYFWIEKNFE